MFLPLSPLQLFLPTLHVLLGNQSSQYFYRMLINWAQIQYFSKTRFWSPDSELSKQAREGPTCLLQLGMEAVLTSNYSLPMTWKMRGHRMQIV